MAVIWTRRDGEAETMAEILGHDAVAAVGVCRVLMVEAGMADV